jgi:TrmH family RNA methyltransferase
VTTITTRQNEFVQQCRALARERPEGSDLVLLDGSHLVGEALAAGISILRVAAIPRIRQSAEGADLIARLEQRSVAVVDVSDRLLEAMSPVRTPSGLVAIARLTPAPIGRALDGACPLVVVAVDVQDPGNLGAIVRAAEAGHATGVVCTGASADPLGWKARRGSMGSAFRLPVTDRMLLATAVDEIRRRGLRLVATSPRGGTSLFEMDLTRPMAVLMGSEGAGLGRYTLEEADLHLAIPMQAPVESLNVAQATAVIVFEAHRQRTSSGVMVAPREDRP